MSKIKSLVIVDIKTNIIKKFFLYLPVFFITLVNCINNYKCFLFFREEGKIFSEISFGDYLFFLWQGGREFTDSLSFRIPSFITIFFLYSGFLICRYLSVKQSGEMRVFLFAGNSRYVWNLGEIVFCILNTAIYCLTVYATVFVFSLFTGSISLSVSEDVISAVTDKELLQNGFEAACLVFLPILVLVSALFLQFFVSMFAKPVWAYVSVIVLYAFSLLIKNKFLIYNYCMTDRLCISDSDGLSPNYGIYLNSVLILAGIVFCINAVPKRKGAIDR